MSVHSTRRRGIAIGLGLVAALLVPALAAAHPLGNFTINHYAGIRVEPDRVLLDVVIDQAEIPAFQAKLLLDTDGDGQMSNEETDAARVTSCDSLQGSLSLAVNGTALRLDLVEAGLTFPPGVGGLSTMRLVCGFRAAPSAPMASGDKLTYMDDAYADRLGWREIVTIGSGVTLAAADGTLRTSSPSKRLTSYPTNLLTQALADKGVTLVASLGGATLAPFDIPDASPIPGSSGFAAASGPPKGGVVPPPTAANDPTSVSAPTAVAVAAAGAVPGGVSSGDLPSIFRSADLTPVVLLVSILTAAALGAGHALTPGHGKTLMAAYLVGTRGTPLHAAGLGLSVTFSHTLGILVLAGLVVGAQGLLPPDVVVKAAPVIAAFSIVGIGGWMLFGEGRRRWRVRGASKSHEHAHQHGVEHDHGAAHANDHAPDPLRNQAHPHDEEHAHAHDDATAPDAHDHATDGLHSHGGVQHSHLPPAGTPISWRSLFVLGLAGGLIPSTSALLILLGSIAAGRPAFGFVLVVAFGLGMAVVLGGIGLALVLARGRLDRVDPVSPLGRASGYVPLLASVLVFSLGLYLTLQAVAGSPTL
jgi:nickel/cobalt exporter